MKIAVTSQNQKTVTGHAGHCQRFWVYDVDNSVVNGKEMLELAQDQSFHASSPRDPHPLDHVQVLISNSMGKGLAQRLANRGIQGIVTPETDLEQVIAAYMTGALAQMQPGGHHHHDHHHEHHHNHHHHHHAEQEDHECQCNSDG